MANKSGYRNAGIRITIDGERELTAQIKRMQQEYKTLVKEIELTQAQFSSERNTLKALTAEYNATQKAINKLNEVHGKLVEKGTIINKVLKTETAERDRLAQKLEFEKRLQENIGKLWGENSQWYKAQTQAVHEAQIEYDKQAAKVEDLTKAESKNREAIVNNEIATGKLNGQLQKTKERMDDAAKSADGTTKKLDKFGNEVKDADEDVKSLSESFSDLVALKGFEIAQQAMRKLIETIDECVQAYARFEDAAVSVVRTVDGLSLDEAEGFLRELSREIPVAMEKLASVASQGGQYGISKNDLKEYTRVMSGLATSTNLGFENTNAVAQLQGVMRTAVSDYERFASTIVYLGNNSRTTEKDIVNMAQAIASYGKGLGMRESEILGLSAALASMGGQAEGTGTAMTRLMERMDEAVGKGGDSLKAFADLAGMTTSEFQRAFEEDATGSILAVIKGLRNMKDEGAKTYELYQKIGVSNIREKTNIRNLVATYDDLVSYIHQANVAWDENTALAEETAAAYSTAASSITQWENAVDDAAAVLGKRFNGTDGDKWYEKSGLTFARSFLSGLVKFWADTNGLTFDLSEAFFGKAPERISWVSKTPGSADPLELQRQMFEDEEQLVEEHEKRLTSLYSSGSSSILSQQEDAMRQLAAQTAEIREMYESVFDPMEKFSEKGQITAKEFTKNLQSNAEKMREYSDNLVKVLEDPRVSEAMKEYIKGLDPTEAYNLVEDFANDKDGKLIESANSAMDKFNQAISDSSVDTGIATGDVTDAVINTLEGADFGSEGYSAGAALDDGIIKGLASRRKAVDYMVGSIASSIKNRLNNALQIHSPSKVTEEIGEYVGGGLVQGMRNTEEDIKAEAARMAAISANMYNGVLVGLQNGLNASIKVNSKDYSSVLNQISRNTSRNNTVVIEKPGKSSQSTVNDLERALVRGMLY